MKRTRTTAIDAINLQSSLPAATAVAMLAFKDGRAMRDATVDAKRFRFPGLAGLDERMTPPMRGRPGPWRVPHGAGERLGVARR